MIFKELSNIISRIKDFFLKVRIRVRIKAFKVVGIIRILEIVDVIIEIIEIKAVNDAESFYIKYNKREVS